MEREFVVTKVQAVITYVNLVIISLEVIMATAIRNSSI